MKERNGTSYSFGLRLWEIYNGRLIETASKQERLVTHYDLFFENVEAELRRIAHFTGLPDSEVQKAAALVTKRRPHTHFTSEHLARQNTSIAETNQLLRDKSISLAESEARAEEVQKRLRLQLKAAEKLCRFLDEADEAAARLRSSARWQIANPIAALKAKFSPRPAPALLGYGHLERILSVYRTWRSTHPEVAAIDDQIQALMSGAVSAVSQRAAPVEPPVPTRPIEFSVHEQVEISIIIPVFYQ